MKQLDSKEIKKINQKAENKIREIENEVVNNDTNDTNNNSDVTYNPKTKTFSGGIKENNKHNDDDIFASYKPTRKNTSLRDGYPLNRFPTYKSVFDFYNLINECYTYCNGHELYKGGSFVIDNESEEAYKNLNEMSNKLERFKDFHPMSCNNVLIKWDKNNYKIIGLEFLEFYIRKNEKRIQIYSFDIEYIKDEHENKLDFLASLIITKVRKEITKCELKDVNAKWYKEECIPEYMKDWYVSIY